MTIFTDPVTAIEPEKSLCLGYLEDIEHLLRQGCPGWMAPDEWIRRLEACRTSLRWAYSEINEQEPYGGEL